MLGSILETARDHF